MRKRIAEEIERNKEKYSEKTDELPRDSSGRPIRPKGRYDGRGHSPNSHTEVGGRMGLRKPPDDAHMHPANWTPPENIRGDVSRVVARAVFEQNARKLYKAYANAALKGNGYVFQQLAERAYGKLKERVEYEGNIAFQDKSEQDLNERLIQLQGELAAFSAGLNIAAAVDGTIGEDGGSTGHPARTLPPQSEKKD